MSLHLAFTNSRGGGCEHSATLLCSFCRCDCNGCADPTNLPGSASTLLCCGAHRRPSCILYLVRQIPSPPCKPSRGNCLGDTFPKAPRPDMSSLLLPPCYPCSTCFWSEVDGPISQGTGSCLTYLYILAPGRNLASQTDFQKHWWLHICFQAPSLAEGSLWDQSRIVASSCSHSQAAFRGQGRHCIKCKQLKRWFCSRQGHSVSKGEGGRTEAD